MFPDTAAAFFANEAATVARFHALPIAIFPNQSEHRGTHEPLRSPVQRLAWIALCF
jgi:hypothetical protein